MGHTAASLQTKLFQHLCSSPAGLEGNGITFIFTDNEVKDEGFLEYLNNVLSSGEVSNLFARDELDEITGELVPIMKKQFPRRPPTQENLYDYFISRARRNLHVVLCFSPVRRQLLPNTISHTFTVTLVSFAGWREVSQQITQVPWADKWLYNGLV